MEALVDAPRYLNEHLREVPVHVIPCIEGRPHNLSAVEQAAHWGGIWARHLELHACRSLARVGHRPDHVYLTFEREAAEVPGIPYDRVMQLGLIPVAYTVGTTFKPVAPKPLDSVLHWNRW
jgi:hypothetical protein